jgi:hypothetical protein
MAKEKTHIVFKLKGDITPLSWTLAQRNISVNTSEGKKAIAYYPTADTIYFDKMDKFRQEQLVKKGMKISPIVFIGGTLSVEVTNLRLLEYLEAHPKFNKLFYKVDVAETAKQEIEKSDLIFKAAELYGKNTIDTMTIAICLYGEDVLENEIIELEAKVKNECVKNPKSIIDIFEEKGDFKYKKIVAASIAQKIIYVNPTKTAVLWTDSGENIITVATGEKPIDQMAQFIGNKENTSTLQAIHIKLEKSKAPTEVEKANNVDTGNNLTGSDKELLDLQIAYEEKFGHPPGPSKKNDAEWLKMKLTTE